LQGRDYIFFSKGNTKVINQYIRKIFHMIAICVLTAKLSKTLHRGYYFVENSNYFPDGMLPMILIMIGSSQDLNMKHMEEKTSI
jgi:hypothetical protein